MLSQKPRETREEILLTPLVSQAQSVWGHFMLPIAWGCGSSVSPAGTVLALFCEKPVFPTVSLVVLQGIGLSEVHHSLLSEGGRCAAQQEGASNSPQRSDTAAVSPAWPQAEEKGAFQEFKFSSASSIKQHKQRGTVLANVAFWCFAVYDAVVMLKQRTDWSLNLNLELDLCLTTRLCCSKAFGFH